jgi:hypothetical protein
MELLESVGPRPRQARYQAALRPDMKCFLDSKALFGLSSTTILLRALRGRVQGFLSRLESDLPREQRENVGLAFRELLNNAIEWGGPPRSKSEGSNFICPHAARAALSHR